MTTDIHLEFRGVSKRYGRSGTPFVLQGLDLAVRRGQCLLVLGRSGSGKTTLLNLAAGIDRPDEGQVRVDGSEVSALAEGPRARWRARTAGLIFQHHYLPRGVTVMDAVALPLLWAHRETPEGARRRAAEALASVEIEDLAGQRVETLSGGQRQRVAIARTLAAGPPLVLADEPTAQLDREMGERITRMLRQWSRQRGATLIVVSHEADHVDWQPDRRLLLADGRLHET